MKLVIHQMLQRIIFLCRIPNLINENYTVKKKLEELRALNLKLLERQNTWIRALKRGALTKKQIHYYHICGKHFINGVQLRYQSFSGNFYEFYFEN